MKELISILVGFICAGLFVIMFSCGNVEDEIQPIVSNVVIDDKESVSKYAIVKYDSDVEKDKITLLNQSLTESINSRDRDPAEVASYWIESGSVLMAHNFFGKLNTSKSRQKIRTTWRAIFAKRAQWPMNSTIDTIWIDGKGRQARSVGTFAYMGQAIRPFKALYQKNKQDIWKVKAIDYGDNGFIKGFKIIL